MYFSTNLKYLRNKEDLTQRELSGKINLSKNTISRYENNRSKPKEDNILKISRFFNVFRDDLLNNDIKEDEENSKLLTPRELGYNNNKHVFFKKIKGIKISNFRSLKSKYIPLGDNLTIISGKNGTMKSTILGLIAHPFSSPNSATDFFNVPLKTDMREVFKFSEDKDTKNGDYIYFLNGLTSKNEEFFEPIKVTYASDERFRVIVGGHLKGQGNFNLNTSYLNFKRLYPIVETDSKPFKKEIDKKYLDFIGNMYQKIFVKETFKNVEPVVDGKIKNTFGPKNTFYNYESISSGEDNLGFIINKLYAFEQNKSDNPDNLQGIICIDEIEAGLHPVAQKNLINFLIRWSKDNNVQIVCTTHSLYLIQSALELQKKYSRDSIQLNMISTQYVKDNNYNIIENPDYNLAYKELTFNEFKSNKKIFKPIVIMEDDVAIRTLKKLIKEESILSSIDFICDITIDENNSGASYTSIISLVKNGHNLFQDCIFILDADIDEKISKDIANLRNKGAQILKLPSCYSLPIEKEVVKYIYDLDSDDPFFVKTGKEKDSYLQDFFNLGINNLSDLNSIQKDKTSKYKNWKEFVEDEVFNKYLYYYCKKLIATEDFSNFKELFIKFLNDIYESKSLPSITELNY